MKLSRLTVFLTAFVLLATGMALNEALSRAEVRAAATVLGLDFLDNEEIDLLLPDLEERLLDLETIGEADLPNDLSPALVFNPVLRPEQLPTDTTVSYPPFPLEDVALLEDPKALQWATVGGLGRMIHERKLSCREVTEFFLNRLKTHDTTLHCVITLTEERALRQADALDRELAEGKYRGPLHGIPYGAKDLLAAKGYPTTWGAAPYRNQVIDVDAAVIEQLDAAGAVLVAKLSLGALAWGDVWFGETTRNPWNPEQGSSGSSAGSASAVAAGLVPFAIGTETLGSIVSPATVCGATGLRPTFGRVSRYGAMALSWSMDKIGPITRSAADAGLVLAAMANYDARDAHCIRAGFAYSYPPAAPLPPARVRAGTTTAPAPSPNRQKEVTGKAKKSKRIGYYRSRLERAYPFKAQDSLVLVTLEGLGYELVPVELPEEPNIAFLLNVEAAAAFETLTRSGRDDELTRQIRRAWPNTFRSAHFVPAVAYVQANRLRRQLMEDVDRMLTEANVEVYVHPSWHSNSLFITNLTGHPCLTVPNGMSEDGTPTSVTFTGRLFGEQNLVNVAAAYQRATPWDERHPPGF